MVKANIEFINDDGIIVVCSKDLKGLCMADFIKECNKFNRTDKKLFITAVELKIRNLLADYGIIIKDNSENALKNAFDELRAKWNKTIRIIDRYENTKSEIIFKEKGITTIIDTDNIISCANEIKVVDYGNDNC